MKKKIFIYFIILLIVGASITGIFISEIAQYYYKLDVESKLKNIAGVISIAISQELEKTGGSIPEADFYEKTAKVYASVLQNTVSPGDANTAAQNSIDDDRITFVDYGGKVLGDSYADYRTMENHSNRKEIQQAIAGGTGIDVRQSQTVGLDYLYIAVPLKQYNVIIRVSILMRELRNIYMLIWTFTAVGVIAGIALTIFFAVRMTSSLTEPMKGLVSASEKITKGDYTRRSNVKTKDELGELSENINVIAEKLQNTITELTDTNLEFDAIMNSTVSGIIAVDRDSRFVLMNKAAMKLFNITDEKYKGKLVIELIRNSKIEALLAQTIRENSSLYEEISLGSPDSSILMLHTNPIRSGDPLLINNGAVISVQDVSKVRKLEQLRTEFVSNVTHELKTPLTSIRGFIETLKGGAVNDPEVAVRFLEIIDIEAERLNSLINDVLYLSEIETGQKDLNIDTHLLKPIVDDVFSMLESQAAKKSIVLSGEIDDKLAITANKDRIKQMMINLLDNAIKYNKDNGSVTVKAWKEEGRVVISVIDTGIGIPQEHQNRVFERFYRVDRGRSRSMGGTGLGLSIVKHIVNLYSGDIRLKSEPGKGSEFTILFPA